MAGIDLLNDIVGSTAAQGSDSELLYNSADVDNKRTGLASQQANKYNKIQKADDTDGGNRTRTAGNNGNVQGSTTTEMTVVIDGNNSSNHSRFHDISAAFNEENDPSKYMGIYEDIKREIKGISKNIDRIESLAVDYESADKSSEYKIIMDRLDIIISNNRKLTLKLKTMITDSKKENDKLLSLKKNEGSSMMQWRVNQLNSCIKQFKSTNMLFEQSLKQFNKTMKETQKRQIRIVNTDDQLYQSGPQQNGKPRKLDDNEIDELLEDPQAATQFLNKALQLQDVSDVLMDRLSELEMRHEGMLRIEQSIKELHQLWYELSIIIDEQQELLDNIENNVIKTKDFVESGTKHLTKAEKHQKMSRKLTCCLFCCLLIIALVIVGYFSGALGL